LKLGGKGNDSQVLQITPLRYITAESASAAITPMIQPQGRILNLANLNIIGIITTPTILDRVNRLIQIIDADPFVHRGIRLFRLQNSKASEVKAELDQILQAVMGSAPAYQVIALERINAILIVAPPKGGFREVEMWINVLDKQSDESIEQIFIYRVKNLEAKELAATLSDVFKQEDKKDEEVKKKEDELDTTLPSGQLPLQVSDNKAALEKERGGTRNNGAIAVSAELEVNIVADEKTNSLLIRATPRDYQQLLETIRILDRVPKEVMVNVVIAQVTLTETTKFGIDWTALINRFGIDSNGSSTQSNVSTSFGTTNTSGLVLNYFSGDITALLNLVDSDSSVSLLSRPSILVRNNEEASINVGTNEPVITRTNSSTSNINTTGYISNEVQYRDTGIILKVTPRINDDGIINMKVSQEVSQIDTSRGEQQYPAFSQRKIETNVVIRDATAIVIGGLIQDNGNYGNSGLPILRKTKLKALFSSTSDENTRTELVLIIVPQIVNPELNNDPLLEQFKLQMNLVDSLFLENEMNFNQFTQQYSQEKYNKLYQ
jgi:general secretion pathway protein D